MNRAEESLSSSKTLLKIGNLRDSVALSYYAMYHSLLSLFFRVGIKCENHGAALIILKEIFKKDSAPISKAKSKREDTQYYLNSELTEKEAKKQIKSAEQVLSMIADFSEKLKEAEIRNYREKLASLSEAQK